LEDEEEEVVAEGRPSRVLERYEALIEELAAEEHRGFYEFKLKESTVGRRLLGESREEQRGFVLAAVGWLDRRVETAARGEGSTHDHQSRTVRAATVALLRRRLPFEHDDVISLLDWSIGQPSNYWRGDSQMVKVVEDYLEEHPLTPALEERIGRLVALLESEYNFDAAATRRRVVRLKELGGLSDQRVPLAAGEAWSDAAIGDIEAMDGERRSAWIELLGVCANAGGSEPSARWSKAARSPLEKIGLAGFKGAVLRWFPLVDRPRTRTIESWSRWAPDPNQLIDDANADVLKGLVWLCAGDEDGEISRSLTSLAISAYKKVPKVGPRCVRVGNACVWALGNMPGMEGIGQLALLKVRVKFGTARKGIETALNTAAERAGLPREEIEEMSVPTYGLSEVGLRRDTLGDFTAELVVTGTSSTELRWTGPDGKGRKSVPKAVKEGFGEDLKELKGTAKDVEKMLPAQRDRIENLYLEEKSWPFPVWRERYLDHPLVGTLARRLIWLFGDGDGTAGVFHDGRIVDRTGRELGPFDEGTRVGLWHPIAFSTEEVLGWRDWLAELEIKQPFKQAHREVYLLTDAERNTRLYSNRFAAHVLKQHQFNALCAVRGWKNKLRLMVDDAYPPATRFLPAHGLRAEYWVEGVGDHYGTDTNESGTYLYLATDQVRFYREEALENLAHAGGGGYTPAGRFVGGRYVESPLVEPLALEEVPPLVFSEVMRDADLFVGVASVGNDPNWSDGGPEGRYREYWAHYSFGDLSETAKTRKAVLERLVPRLKISERCSLTERFLVVRGDIRTYRIHLGSGNILMQPNDQYLCIVPSQGVSGNVTGKVFLPFEGDKTLAIVLSKAFLLANDKEIKDPTILSQIRP
jgi:hypothetical protein